MLPRSRSRTVGDRELRVVRGQVAVIGGSGALGSLSASLLLQNGCRRVVLLSRGGTVSIDSAQLLSNQVRFVSRSFSKAALQEAVDVWLCLQDAFSEIVVKKCDMTFSEEAAALLDPIQGGASAAPWGAVWNAGGVLQACAPATRKRNNADGQISV